MEQLPPTETPVSGNPSHTVILFNAQGIFMDSP